MPRACAAFTSRFKPSGPPSRSSGAKKSIGVYPHSATSLTFETGISSSTFTPSPLM